jgi:hypothetical protein
MAIAVVAIVMPRFLYPAATLLFVFGDIAGTIVSKILLTAIFYLFITPVAVIRRLFKKDSLQLNGFKKSKISVFKERNHVFNSLDFIYSF